MPISHLPAATSRAASRSPPEGFCARLALMPRSHSSALASPCLASIGREQRVVVDVLAGADADLALPLRIGELFVGDRVLLDAVLRGVDHARAHRDAGPMAVGIAVLRRHDLVDHDGLDRLGDAGLHGLVHAADVDRQQHVGRAVGALGLHALLEPRTCRDDVDLDAGVLGEGVEQRLDQLGFAVGVDVDFAAVGRGRRDDGRGEAKHGRGSGTGAKILHESGSGGVMKMPFSVAQRLPCREGRCVANVPI